MHAARNQPSSVASCSDVFGPASSASATPSFTSVSRTYARRQRHFSCYNQHLAIYACSQRIGSRQHSKQSQQQDRTGGQLRGCKTWLCAYAVAFSASSSGGGASQSASAMHQRRSTIATLYTIQAGGLDQSLHPRDRLTYVACLFDDQEVSLHICDA